MNEFSAPNTLALSAELRVDLLCRRFEDAWIAGTPPSVEEYLAQTPGPEKQALLGELLRLDIEYRLRAGQTPTQEEYTARFPHAADRIVLLLGGTWTATPSAAGEKTNPHRAAPAGSPAVSLAPGYEILGELGRGGMGVVYKVRDFKLNRIVALKMILAGGHADAEQLLRFLIEAEAVAQLQHANIVPIFEIGRHNDLPYFTLEYVSGGSLAQQLKGEPQPPRAAAQLVEQLAYGVQAAHQRGIVHRDLKPANVLLAEDGTPKITDFGLAKRVEAGHGLTSTGAIVGTPSYMSPEQAGGKNRAVGPATDIYALGVILYELLTGRAPFKAATAIDTLMQICTDEPVPPRQLQSKTPGDLETICLKCLQKEPAKRYGSAQALAEDLGRFQRGEPITARAVGTGERAWRWCRRNPSWAALLGTVAALLVMIAVSSLVAAAWFAEERSKSQAAEKQATQQRQAAERNLERAAKAERHAREREADALIGQARGTRLSRRPGHRFESLAALEKAAEIGRALDQPAAWFDRVRNETIAALALPDLHITHVFGRWPAGTIDLDLSPDFELYARTTPKGDCSVRRVADDAEIAHLPERGAPSCVLFGPRRLLAVNGGFRCQLWDLTSSKPVLRVDQPRAGWQSFRPDGRLLVVVYTDGSWSVFETDTGKRRHRLAANGITDGPLPFLHPTEPVAVVSSFSSRLLQLRDLRTGAVLKSLTLPWRIQMCVWSPDGRMLAASPLDGGGSAQLYAFDPATGNLRLSHALQPLASGGNTLCFNPAGDRLATRGWGGVVNLFNAVTGQLLFSTRVPTGFEGLLRFDSTGKRLAMAAVGPTMEQIGVWSVAAEGEYRGIIHQGSGVCRETRPAIHPNGRLAVVGLSHGLAVFDLETGRELDVVQSPQGADCHGYCFDGAGNLFANTTSLTAIFRWPLHSQPGRPTQLTLGPVEQLPFPASHGRDVATSRDGRVVAQATWGPGAWVLLPGGKQARQLTTGSMIYVSVSPDGRWVTCGEHNGGEGAVFEAATGWRAWQFRNYHGYSRFSSDGRWLLAQDNAGGQAYAVPTWKPGQRLGPGTPWDVSPDGRLAVVGQTDGVYRLVEVATGREVARLEDPDQIAKPAVFTPDGACLVVAAGDGLRVWDLRLIRKKLTRLGLDWHAPPYPEAAPGKSEPLKLAVVHPRFVRPNGEAAAKTVERATAALQTNPEDAEAYHHRAHAYEELGDYVRAEADFSSALKGRPTDAHFLACRGRDRLHLLRYEDALVDLQKALEGKLTKVDVASVCAELAWVRLAGPLNRRDAKAALPLAERAVALASHIGYSRAALALACFRLERLENARVHAETSVADKGKADGFDLYVLALIHARQKALQKARDNFAQGETWRRANKNLPAYRKALLETLRGEAEAAVPR